MIIGVGIDAVRIPRMERLIERYGDRILRKVFTGEEIADGGKRARRAEFFAGRFAAREAFYKALGTGWGRGSPLGEVSVRGGRGGRPELLLTGRAAREAESAGADALHLSITHEGDTAYAVVILEGTGETGRRPG